MMRVATFLRVDKKVKVKLEGIAKAENKSLNHIISNIFRRYLIEYEKDLNKINGVDS